MMASRVTGSDSDDSSIGVERKKSKNYYHRLVAYIVTVAPFFLEQYIEKIILKGQPLSSFLSQNKHYIFHMYFTAQCCTCTVEGNIHESKSRNAKLSKNQFSILYEEKKIHTKCKNTPKCICGIAVHPNVDVKLLDITMINCIFSHDPASGAKVWIDKIKDIRNNIFHLSDAQRLEKGEFGKYWYQLSGSVGGLANLTGPEYSAKLKKSEKRIMHQELTSSNILNEQILLKMEYKRKYEKLQLQLQKEMNKMARNADKILEGTTPKKNQVETLVQKIDSLETTLNKIAISVSGDEGVTKFMKSEESNDEIIDSDMQTVPVLFHMDVPKHWDKDEIADSVEKMIKTFNEEGNTRTRIKGFSTGELNIILEILRRVMRKPEELQLEIKQIVTDILDSSNIDTSEEAGVNVTLLAPDDVSDADSTDSESDNESDSERKDSNDADSTDSESDNESDSERKISNDAESTDYETCYESDNERNTVNDADSTDSESDNESDSDRKDSYGHLLEQQPPHLTFEEEKTFEVNSIGSVDILSISRCLLINFNTVLIVARVSENGLQSAFLTFSTNGKHLSHLSFDFSLNAKYWKICENEFAKYTLHSHRHEIKYFSVNENGDLLSSFKEPPRNCCLKSGVMFDDNLLVSLSSDHRHLLYYNINNELELVKSVILKSKAKTLYFANRRKFSYAEKNCNTSLVFGDVSDTLRSIAVQLPSRVKAYTALIDDILLVVFKKYPDEIYQIRRNGYFRCLFFTNFKNIVDLHYNIDHGKLVIIHSVNKCSIFNVVSWYSS